MSATRTVFGRMFVFGCSLFVMAFAAQMAQAGLKPEAPPHARAASHTVGPLQPVPGPGASTKTSAASRHSSPSVTASTTRVHRTTVPRTAVAAAIVRATSHSLAVAPRQHTAARPKARHRVAEKDIGWPVGLRDAAGLNELSSVASSRGSKLLLAAGFALLLLVIAEASFLGLAGSRLGGAGARTPSKRPPADDSYAIRPVQLRR